MVGRVFVLNRLKPWLYRHYGCTFVLMGLSFFAFGAMVIEDGALLQLLGYGYLNLAFYLLFKACEHILVIRLTEDGPADHER